MAIRMLLRWEGEGGVRDGMRERSPFGQTRTKGIRFLLVFELIMVGMYLEMWGENQKRMLM